MLQAEMLASVVAACAGVTLLVVSMNYLRTTVGASPTPPSAVAEDCGEHYYCLDCHADFSDRPAALAHAEGNGGHEVTLLRNAPG